MIEARALIYHDDHTAFRDSVRDFLARDVTPDYGSWRADHAIPPEVLGAAGEYGFLGFGAPEHLGGSGVDDPRFAIILVDECLQQGHTGLALVLAMHVGVCIPHIARYASERQQHEWLPRLTAGQTIGSVIDGAALHDNGDDTVSAALAGGPGTLAAGLVLAPVLSTEEVLLIGVDEGSAVATTGPEEFIGIPEAPGTTVILDRRRRGGDIRCAQQLIAATHAWTALVHAGSARAALNLAVHYANDRKVFGRPLAGFENTRTVLGSAAAHTHAVSELAYATVLNSVQGADASAHAAAARLVASAAHRHNADLGLQLHGGYGYMREYAIAQCFADAAVLTAMPAIGAPMEAVLADSLGL